MSDAGVEFSHFVISLAQGVMVGLGEVPDPETRKTHLNLPMANHSLAVLQMLKIKTVGNLSADEQKLIDALLKDLTEKLEQVSS